MTHFIYNGKLLTTGTPVFGPDNRGARYGDGLFETIKVLDSVIQFQDDHFARLWNGMSLLDFEIPRLFKPELLEEMVHRLIQKNKHANARVRINVVRGNGGLYEPGVPEYTIESWLLPKQVWNENGLQIDIYRDIQKAPGKFSACKHNNFLPYVMGAIYAKKNRINDAIILNTNETICDSTIANVFTIKNGIIYTPPLSEGCVAGISRKNMLRNLPDHGFEVKEKIITETDLMEADELFLTNAIFGLKWVAACSTKVYSNTIGRKIYDQLVKPGSE